jgi:hypothetical protein
MAQSPEEADRAAHPAATWGKTCRFLGKKSPWWGKAESITSAYGPESQQTRPAARLLSQSKSTGSLQL